VGDAQWRRQRERSVPRSLAATSAAVSAGEHLALRRRVVDRGGDLGCRAPVEVEQYEIVLYKNLISGARAMGRSDVVEVLKRNLQNE
jgi:ferritin-like metal-binding protein YciE